MLLFSKITLRKSYRIIAFGCLFSLIITIVSVLTYFSSVRYDVPFRIMGHYEKTLYLIDRPFALSPNGTILVYSSRTTGYGDLYRANMDGGNIQQLTSVPDYESAPCFSPDGRWLVFCRETNHCGHIWRIILDGSVTKQLTFGPDYDTNPLYTPDGKYLWFQRTPQGSSPGHDQIFTMTPEGQKVTILDRAGNELGRQAAFCIQNDSVYYTQKNTSISPIANYIWQMHADYTDRHPIARGRYPAVSRNGTQIAFVAGPWDNEIWLMNPDASHQHQVYRSQGNKHYVAFSPDSNYLYFQEETPHGTCISRVTLNGTDYRRLVEIQEGW